MSKIREEIVTPHFAFPFRFERNGANVAVEEQGTSEEIADCAEVLLRTPLGERVDAPELGVPDQTFREGGADVEGIEAIINEYEPRASAQLEQDEMEDLVARVRVNLRGSY